MAVALSLALTNTKEFRHGDRVAGTPHFRHFVFQVLHFRHFAIPLRGEKLADTFFCRVHRVGGGYYYSCPPEAGSAHGADSRHPGVSIDLRLESACLAVPHCQTARLGGNESKVRQVLGR